VQGPQRASRVNLRPMPGRLCGRDITGRAAQGAGGACTGHIGLSPDGAAHLEHKHLSGLPVAWGIGSVAGRLFLMYWPMRGPLVVIYLAGAAAAVGRLGRRASGQPDEPEDI
jgi:hypothetical protein